MNEEKNLTPIDSFQSIIVSDEALDTLGEITEVCLDQFLDDGLWKDMPIIGTVVSIIKTFGKIQDIITFKMQLTFIQQLRNGCVSEKVINKRKEAYQKKEKWFSEETEKIVLYLARCTDYKKAKLYAEIYLDFINKEISYETMSEYFEIVDRIMLPDIIKLDQLNNNPAYKPTIQNQDIPDEEVIEIKDIALGGRLASIGLVGFIVGFSFGADTVHTYKISEAGFYFLKLINRIGA